MYEEEDEGDYITLEEAFASNMTIREIFEEFGNHTEDGPREGLSWDQIQRQRKAYRELHGLPVLKRGRRGNASPTPTPSFSLPTDLSVNVRVTLQWEERQLQMIMEAFKILSKAGQ